MPILPSLHSIQRGKVTSVRDFGCFLKLNGFKYEALLHAASASDRPLNEKELRANFPLGKAVWVLVTSIGNHGKVSVIARGIDQLTGRKLRPGEKPSQPASNARGLPEQRGGAQGEGAARSSEKPPELFSIHKAEVVSATDFALYVRTDDRWDVMVHTTQLDEQKLRAANAKMPLDVYRRGLRVYVKISNVDGVSKKAKLQGSIKYVEQRSGRDLDPKHEKLMYDLTSRGLSSEMSRRWNSSNRSPSPSPQRDSAVEGFVASREYEGSRGGMVFKLGDAGLGYYPDSLAPGAAKAAKSALLEAALKRLEAEESERKRKKKEKKAMKKQKKERKRKDKEDKKRKRDDASASSDSDSDDSALVKRRGDDRRDDRRDERRDDRRDERRDDRRDADRRDADRRDDRHGADRRDADRRDDRHDDRRDADRRDDRHDDRCDADRRDADRRDADRRDR